MTNSNFPKKLQLRYTINKDEYYHHIKFGANCLIPKIPLPTFDDQIR
ncbi:hypothetical protein MuYL_3074 [Mucilaginibacter xinganensis]|uniref:Uncharacterized protein n=1 Tax=Mucilaginibacter xinganensis TaxID=1234841 RepID=A0A223NYK0_9SPHI|nr:hypothetical protein MuYL_3074 [Mucilaginibacter xinganensis]